MNTYITKVCLLVLIVSMSLAGCGTMQTFSGNQLPASETALVKGSGIFPFKDICITSVDKESLGLTNSKAVLLPGSHLITIHLYQSYGIIDFTADGALILNAQAGHEYAVQGERSNGKVYFWIEDTKTAEIVSGKKPE